MYRTEQDQHFDVGGQAVMEGVMMRSPTATAVTVRRPDGTMVTKLTPFVPLKDKHPWMGKRFIRGIINIFYLYICKPFKISIQFVGSLTDEPAHLYQFLHLLRIDHHGET